MLMLMLGFCGSEGWVERKTVLLRWMKEREEGGG